MTRRNAAIYKGRIAIATIDTIRQLVDNGEVRISNHGYDELADDGITVREILAGVSSGVVVEDYPSFGKGPAVLVLQKDAAGMPVHVVWGLPKVRVRPTVLVTAYRPDPDKWSNDFMERLK